MKSVAWIGAALTLAVGGCENSRNQPTYGTEQAETRREGQQDTTRTQEDTGTTGETGAYGTGESQAEPQGGATGGGAGTQTQTGGQAMQGGQGACQQLSTCYQVLQRSLCSDNETCRSQFEAANTPSDESACRTRLSQIRESVQPYIALKSDFTMPTECGAGQ